MKNKNKKIWKDWFEGGKSIWSEYGYNYHSYLIAKNIISSLNFGEGKFVQFGTGLGLTIEYLCNQFGYDRVIGYDMFNPLNHPNIHSLDVYTDFPQDMNLCYTDIDIGDVRGDYDIRIKLFDWALKNTKNGYILINKSIASQYNNLNIIELSSFNNIELWKSPHQSRLFTKVLIEIKTY